MSIFCNFILLNFYVHTIQWLERNMLTCPSKKLLHMECPGCGLQRSYIALLKGDLLSSFQLYPAAIPILLMVMYLFLHLVFQFKNGAVVLSRLYIFCAIIILVHYIYKIAAHQIF